MSSKIHKIAILGRFGFTNNYERFVTENGYEPVTTINPQKAILCHGLILPGGGDITPAFFGQSNKGSEHIDTELDILQILAFELFLQKERPILGICKGMQLINIALGGTLCQDMIQRNLHLAPFGDLYHDTNILPGSFLHTLYGEQATVNSAHHQCIARPGRHLSVIQTSCTDHCPEAICHDALPVLGLQWHPERLDTHFTPLSGKLLFSRFFSAAL